MDFSILVPTKNRSNNILRLLSSINDSCDVPGEIEVLFYYDKDDIETEKLSKSLERYGFDVLFFTEEEGVVKYNNWWDYLSKKSSGKYIMQGGDDLVFKTKGWDSLSKNIIEENVEKNGDRILLLGTWDGSEDHKNGELITHSIVTREWIDALGYFTTGKFSGFFNDTWLTELAKRIDRLVFCQDIMVEHLHPFWGKAEYDDVYEKQESLSEKAKEEWKKMIKNIDIHVDKLIDKLNN